MSKAARTRLPGVRSAYARAWPLRPPSWDCRCSAQSPRRVSIDSRASTSRSVAAAPVPKAASGIVVGESDIPASVLQHGLDFQFRRGQALTGRPQSDYALLEQQERGIELHVVRFQLTDDFFQPGKLLS